jgi:hypothetical protein
MRVLFCLCRRPAAGLCGLRQSDTYPRRPTAQEMANAEGLYGLSDGYRAHIFELDSRLYVRIGAGPEKMLQAVGPDRFRHRIPATYRSSSSPSARRTTPSGSWSSTTAPPGGHPPALFSTGPRPGRGFVD